MILRQFLLFDKTNFIHFYSSRKETFPVNSGELVLGLAWGGVLLLFIGSFFIDGYHGKFSMAQYLESLCIDNTFKKVFIGHFTEAVKADSKIYWWYYIGGNAGSLDKVSFVSCMVYSTDD